MEVAYESVELPSSIGLFEVLVPGIVVERSEVDVDKEATVVEKVSHL